MALAAVALYALLGFLVVPWIARGQIRKHARAHLDRDATVARVAFNPFTLAATLEGFRLADRDGGDLLVFDRLRIDMQVAGLFRRAWRFREVLLERPVVTARILEDGKPSVADLMRSDAAPAEPEEPFRLPRMIIDRLAVTAGRVEFSDRSRRPVFDWRFEPLNLEVRELITIPEESGEHSVTIGAGSGAELRWTGAQSVDPLRFTGRFDITGLRLPRLWEYFGRDQPLDVADGRADLVLPYDLRRGPEGKFDLSVAGASLEVRGLIARPRGASENWLAVPVLQVRDVEAAWPAARVAIGGVRISKPEALVRIEADGRLNWATALPPAGGTEPPGEGGRSWQGRVGAVEIEGGTTRFEDRTTEPAVVLDLSEVGLEIEDLSTDLGTPVAFRAKARVHRAGALEAKGSVVPDPLAAEVEFDLQGLDLLPLRPYAELPGARLASGVAALSGSARVSGAPPTVSFTGAGRLDAVEIQDAPGGRLLAWERMGVEGLRLDGPPARARIGRVAFDGAFAKVFIDREGNLNLTRLATPAGEPSAAPAAPLRVEIGTVDLRDGAIDFTDQSLILPFGTKIHSTHGSLRDLSTFGAAAATLALEGRVAETGYVKVGGSIRLADPMASSDVEVDFRSLEMPTLTPYAATFAGYAIESGVLDLDVHYRVQDRRLVGEHRVVAGDLVLGDKVEGASGVGLPVRLAVALLKDKDGRIDLEVPIEGSVDSPEFAYRKVVWQAVKTILGNIAKAPFRALGRLFGRDEEDLELVEFDPGRSDLLPAEQDKLARLAEHLGPREELTLEVEGRFDPVSDLAALRRMKLEAAIEARRAPAAAVAEAADASTLETVLEALFVERFSAEALEAERRSFMPAPPSPPEEFDAAGFYEALRGRLLEAQTVTEAELTDLAAARSAAIVAAVTATGAVAESRVGAVEPVPVKRKKAGSERIASEMILAAPDRPPPPSP